jgi:hypothetical protein
MTLQRSDFRNALLVLLALLGALTALMSVLNLAVVNNVLFPITQYVPMFEILWRDNPSAALGILADKSLLAIGHFDFDSGLYLWTLEFDTLTLLVFSAVALAAAFEWRRNRLARKWVWAALALIVFSRAYGQVLAHCAGSTWLGFVSLYALGVDKFPVNAVWQWLFALLGLGLLAWQLSRAAPPATRT